MVDEGEAMAYEGDTPAHEGDAPAYEGYAPAYEGDALAYEGEAPAIGIDLGTTYSCVAVWQHDRVEIIPNEQGSRIIPSCVSFTDTKILIGEAAMNAAAMNPTNTVFAVKRLIGRRFSDPSVQNDIKLWPFTVVSGFDDKPKIVVKYMGQRMQFSAEEISAMLIARLKKAAEVYLGRPVKNAVITVPAYFNHSQRCSTIVAGAIAGLTVTRIMDEPTAAAVAYGLDKMDGSSDKKNVLVFNLGGGACDVSLLSMSNGIFVVKATAGDTHLGGEDFNDRMVKYCIDKFKTTYLKDITRDLTAVRRVRTECEKAKRVLSSQSPTVVKVDCNMGIKFSAHITRDRFEELNRDLFEKCMELVMNCLKDADMESHSIDVAVLVGGSTHIPKVRRFFKKCFHKEKIYRGINPEEAVAHGAAVQAAKLCDQGSTQVQDMVIIDVTPLSLGIETSEGKLSILVPRNTPIPTKMSKGFTTGYDNQTEVGIKVYEGEREKARHNNLLGIVALDGIAPAPRGEAVIDISLEIDANGTLSVTARHKATGQEINSTITSYNGRTNGEELERLMSDAERFKAEEDEYRRKHKAWISLNRCIYEMQNAIKNKNTAWMLSSATKSRIEEVFERARRLVEQRPIPNAIDSEAMMEELKSISCLVGLSPCNPSNGSRLV